MQWGKSWWNPEKIALKQITCGSETSLQTEENWEWHIKQAYSIFY